MCRYKNQLLPRSLKIFINIYALFFSGPPAPLGSDGRVVDTPEVQQAKAVHFSLYNAEAQRGPAGPAAPANPSWNHGGGYNPSWGQPNSWNQWN